MIILHIYIRSLEKVIDVLFPSLVNDSKILGKTIQVLFPDGELVSLYAVYNIFDFSKYSLQLYLLNGYLLVVSRTIIVSLISVENPLIIIAFNMLTTLFASWLLIKHFISKYNLFRFLLGII